MDNSPGTTREWVTLFVSLFIAYGLVAFYVKDAILAMLAAFFLPVTMHGVVIGNLANNFKFGVCSTFRVPTSIRRAFTFTGAANMNAAAPVAPVAPVAPNVPCVNPIGAYPDSTPADPTKCRCVVCACRTVDTANLEQQLREARQYAYETNEFTKTVWDGFNGVIDRLMFNLAQTTPAGELGRLGTWQDRIHNARETLQARKLS